MSILSQIFSSSSWQSPVPEYFLFWGQYLQWVGTMTVDFPMQQKRRIHNQSYKYRLRCRTQDATRWKSVKSHLKVMAISNRSSLRTIVRIKPKKFWFSSGLVYSDFIEGTLFFYSPSVSWRNAVVSDWPLCESKKLRGRDDWLAHACNFPLAPKQ